MFEPLNRHDHVDSGAFLFLTWAGVKLVGGSSRCLPLVIVRTVGWSNSELTLFQTGFQDDKFSSFNPSAGTRYGL